jgi:small subunit ribosomal protein S2
MRAIRLYTANIADAILEGRASVTTADANEEFVEVAESSAEQAGE